jgi:hypothetical protein
MKPSKYIRKTFRRGSFLGKFIKLLRLFQHTFYFIVKKKIGSYTTPSEEIREIGVFDTKRRVHTDQENEKYFSEWNLYMGGSYSIMKPGIIALFKLNERIMVRKKFSGVQKYNKFYNELICLHRLSRVDGIPRLLFADYSTCSLYIEYLDGLSFSRGLGKRRIVIDSENYNQIKEGYLILLREMHSRGVMMYDMRDENMMMYDSVCCLFDFADSIYAGIILSQFTSKLKQNDFKKLDKELLLSGKSELFQERLSEQMIGN